MSDNPYAKKYNDYGKNAPRNWAAAVKGTRLSVKNFGLERAVRSEGLTHHRKRKEKKTGGTRRRGRKTRSTRRR